MDFYQISLKKTRSGDILSPSFIVKPSKDLMVRGKSFYAIWDEEAGLWSTNEYDAVRIIDKELEAAATPGVKVDYLRNYRIGGPYEEFHKFMANLSNSYVPLDEKVTFANDIVKKTDYVSRRLSYDMAEGSTDAYDELMDTLYNESERRKIEWAIGSVIAGTSKDIQKFFVFYGKAGTGKSTVLHIIEDMFDGYVTLFDAKELAAKGNQFALSQFKNNALIAIQQDGDLSKIEDNTKINSLVSHEKVLVNEKYKAPYEARFNAMLFMGTNNPVKITDSKSGILRRLIDISPSGRTLDQRRYDIVMNRIKFEYGAIAYKCLKVFEKYGSYYYKYYEPTRMMFTTNLFFNFVEENRDVFMEQNSTTLRAAYDIYKEFMKDSGYSSFMHKGLFREELKAYFEVYRLDTTVNGKHVRNYYEGFKEDIFEPKKESNEEEVTVPVVWNHEKSLLDTVLQDCPAQYAKSSDSPRPRYGWDQVKTTLKDIDTRRVHYVRPPENLIIIDFDLKDENGEKSLEKNLKAAEAFPPTYGEVSQSGQGLHLHYFCVGDTDQLSAVYSEGIEIKKFTGKSALRRRFSMAFGDSIATIQASSLPSRKGKGRDKVVESKVLNDEKHLIALINKCLNKEIFPNTKPSVDFINKLLNDAYESGMKYDVTDYRNKILQFALGSTHQAQACVKMVSDMHFKSDEPSNAIDSDGKLVFFDVEVFPNLFVICWKYEGSDSTVKMINPTPEEVEELFKFKLVGFNNRRYDNHIIYARAIRRYTNQQLFELSQKMINSKDRSFFFGEAYNLSYTDVYDFASAAHKKGLKKWEIELGIHHLELPLPWDQPVDPSLWEQVADYCVNDVVSTEVVFNHLHGDFVARQILARLSGLTVNDTTNSHSTKIIFGNEKHPKLVYTDLSEMFPGYEFKNGKSFYRGEEVGEGGYVYAEPGIYGEVPVLDIASMHPTSIECLGMFGDVFTKRFSDLKTARIYIKHGDLDGLSTVLGGALVDFVSDPTVDLKDLSNALKTVINSVYGLTSASFDNPFRDPRNIDNIVAKRGALFMIDLKHAVQDKGFTVVHIKTDSIKIADANDEIIEFVKEFGKKYGYTFEHEDTYDKMCLVNDAVYIAKSRNDGKWHATGAQFAHPYVFKTMFSHEDIVFSDYCETKAVSTAMYLDMNEGLKEDEHNYVFVGRVGSFVPVLEGCGGGILLRQQGEKYNAVTGTKGYRWKEAEKVSSESKINKLYFRQLVDDAWEAIEQYGDAEWFTSDAEYDGGVPFAGSHIVPFPMNPPENAVA